MRGLQAAGGAPLSENDTSSSLSGPLDAAGGRDGRSAGEPPSTAEGESREKPSGKTPGGKRRIGVLALLALSVYVLDLVSKILVVEYIEGQGPIHIIGEYVQFRVIRNSGAAFSIGTGMTIVFTAIAAAVAIAIIRTARHLRSLPWAITLGMLLGGALGNLTDRIFRAPAPLQGHVVDFIQVFPATNFPIFNVADSSIVCGGIAAVFLAWRGYQIDGTRDHGVRT